MRRSNVLLFASVVLSSITLSQKAVSEPTLLGPFRPQFGVTGLDAFKKRGETRVLFAASTKLDGSPICDDDALTQYIRSSDRSLAAAVSKISNGKLRLAATIESQLPDSSRALYKCPPGDVHPDIYPDYIFTSKLKGELQKRNVD